jgi:hypothetical protein
MLARYTHLRAAAGKQGRRLVSAFIGTAFAQDDAQAAITRLIGGILLEQNPSSWSRTTNGPSSDPAI